MLRPLIASALGAIALSAAALAVTSSPALGDDTDVIVGSVLYRAKVPCLSLQLSDFSFGEMDEPAPTVSNSLTVQTGTLSNCAQYKVDVFVSGTDFEGPTAKWDLDEDGGFGCPSSGDPNRAWLRAWLLGTPDVSEVIANKPRLFGVVPPGSFPLFHSMSGPCFGAAGQGETFKTSITYTAIIHQ